MGSSRAIYSNIAPRTNQIRGRGGYIAVYSPTRPHVYNIYPTCRVLITFQKNSLHVRHRESYLLPSPDPLPEPVALACALARARRAEGSCEGILLCHEEICILQKKKDCRNSNPTIINTPHPFSLPYHYTTVGLIFNFLLNHKPLRRMKIRTYLIKRLPPLQPRMLNICLLALNTSTPPPPHSFIFYLK